MPDYDFTKFSARAFEQLVQALALKVIGTGVQPFGDGTDGAREATYEGPMPTFPHPGSDWSGYLVLQAKHRQRPARDVGADGTWALGELSAELKKLRDPRRRIRRPEYYVFVTSVVLTPVHRKGTQDKALELLKGEAGQAGLKGYDVWHYDKLCRMIDGAADIRSAYANLLFADAINLAGLSIGLRSRPDAASGGASLVLVQSTSAAGILSVVGPPAAPVLEDAKDDIDRAGNFLTQGHLEVAETLLADVERRYGDRLSPRGQFRLTANRGHLLRLNGDVAGAAQLYLAAKRHQPDDLDARFLEALAHHFLGENQTASRLARDLKRDAPALARASLIQLMAAPPDAAHADLAADLAPNHLNNGEVATWLGRRALAFGDLAGAEGYARHARAAEPDWVEPMLLLAEAIVGAEFGETGWPQGVTPDPRQAERLRGAGQLFESALGKGGQVDAPTRATIRLGRAAVWEALGDRHRARAEAQAVYHDNPSHPDAAMRYAADLAGERRQTEAVDVLRPIVGVPDCPPQTALLYAQLLADRDGAGDRQAALT